MYHMKKLLLLIVCLLNLTCLCGQTFREWTLNEALQSSQFTLYSGVYREPWPHFSPWHLKKVKALDNACLRVTYDVGLVVDTLGVRKYAKDRAVVLVGERIIHSFGYYFWCQSMQNTVSIDEAIEYGRPMDYKDIINWFVYRDLKEKRVANYHAIPLKKDYAIVYEEGQPTFNWEIRDETLQILGYLCQKAETSYAGRNWTVWFCPEIPVDCGLWKFAGLPGLIMKAEDEELYYSFSCIGIERTEESIDIPIGITLQRLKRDVFRRVEREHYSSPIQNSDREKGYMIGSHIGRNNGANDYSIFTPDNYMHPYFPMEVE